mmetsp:Transcript_2658/g.4123  ORF Transcript_2658/g.4123 Transcript_2658/m.4123 type:complete len:119 (+) Transcript_2658:1-357(+)
MGQRRGQLVKLAATKDVPTKQKKEESAEGMGHSDHLPKPAVMKDAPTTQRKEVSVGVMGRPAKLAAMEDAQIMASRVASVAGMQQRLLVKNKYSGGKDAHTRSKGNVLLYTWCKKKNQ